MVQLTYKRDPGTERLANELKDAYGGSVFFSYGGFNKQTETVKYSAEGKVAERILRDILPYARLKKSQVEYALRMREMKSAPYGMHNPKPQHVIDEEDSIYLAMQKQKRKGRE